MGDTERVEKLQRALRSDPSFKVRTEAAAVLGKIGDRDAVPALVQAMMEDKHEQVRASCAEALGQLADPAARAALKAARSDPDRAVQQRAEAALQRLDHPETRPAEPNRLVAAAKRIPVTLGRMGSKARGAISDLPRRLREAIARQLRDTPDVQVVEEVEGKPSGFTVESSVTELSRRTTRSGEVEVTCEVSMIIAILPSHAIVGMTSGGATIQAPLRRAPRDKAAAQALEADALDHAVRGAHENLVAFLRNQK